MISSGTLELRKRRKQLNFLMQGQKVDSLMKRTLTFFLIVKLFSICGLVEHMSVRVCVQSYLCFF